MSWSSSTSCGSTASGLISTESSFWWPLARTVTTPPPEVPWTSLEPSSSWMRAIFSCISWSWRIIFMFPAMAGIVVAGPGSAAARVAAPDIDHASAEDLLGRLHQALPAVSRFARRGRWLGLGAVAAGRRPAGDRSRHLELQSIGSTVDPADVPPRRRPVARLLRLLAVHRPPETDGQQIVVERRRPRRAGDQQSLDPGRGRPA